MAGVEHFARHCFFQHPFERAVTPPPQISGDPNPIDDAFAPGYDFDEELCGNWALQDASSDST
jgi:hypothetical protein